MHKRKKGRKFSLKEGKRRALLKSLAGSVILKEKVRTTQAKAKEARSFVEKSITLAKRPGLASRRSLGESFAPKVVKKLIDQLGSKYKDRKGGYTRIIKIGRRKTDGAQMAIIELV